MCLLLHKQDGLAHFIIPVFQKLNYREACNVHVQVSKFQLCSFILSRSTLSNEVQESNLVRNYVKSLWKANASFAAKSMKCSNFETVIKS